MVTLPFSTSPNKFTVTGEVQSSLIALSTVVSEGAGGSSLQKWEMGIGNGFSVHELEVGVVIRKQNGKWHSTGRVHGNMAFVGYEAKVDASLPASGGTYVVSASLSAGATPTVSSIVEAATWSSSLTGASQSGGSLGKQMAE